jgi:signal transduction histidine kinase
MDKKEQEVLFHKKNFSDGRSFLFGSLVLGFGFALFILNIFYETPLRTRIEDKLYDLRMRLAPNFQTIDELLVIAIEEKSLNSLNSQKTPYEVNGSQRRSLADPRHSPLKAPLYARYQDLARLALSLEKTNAKSIAIILPSQIYNYEDPEINLLTAIVKRDKRFVLGVFEVSQKSGDALGIPNTLKPIRDQIYRAELTRDFRRGIIRRAVVQRQGEMTYLIRYLAEQLNPKVALLLDSLVQGLSENENDLMLRPKYSHPSRIPMVTMGEWLHGADQDKSKSSLDGKIVILGYTTYVPATFKSSEATFVNTPWQEEGHDVIGGIPLVTASALIAHSLSKKNWLKEAGIGLNLIQTVFIALFSLRVWGEAWGILRRGRFGIGFAVFLYIGGWFSLLILHGLLFSIYDLYIPLADAALASVFMTTVGVLNRLRYEGRLQAVLEAKTLADQEVALVQDRFLNTFADELASLNQKLRSCLLKIDESRYLGAQIRSEKQDAIFSKALESCEELDDYLNGIRHFSRLEATVGKRMLTAHEMSKTLQRVAISELISKVLSQFEARIREKNIQLVSQIDPESFAHTDRPIAAQILYNLISNAIKYSPQGGRVIVDARNIKQECLISVSDQGPGIEEKLQDKIFEKFYRVKNDHVYKIKGHGLGLYLSHYFSKLINGKIAVDSTLGKGSTFRLILPAKMSKSNS